MFYEKGCSTKLVIDISRMHDLQKLCLTFRNEKIMHLVFDNKIAQQIGLILYLDYI